MVTYTDPFCGNFATGAEDSERRIFADFGSLDLDGLGRFPKRNPALFIFDGGC